MKREGGGEFQTRARGGSAAELIKDRSCQGRNRSERWLLDRSGSRKKKREGETDFR